MRFKNYKIGAMIVAVMLLSACTTVGKYVLPNHQFDSAVIASNDVNPNGVGRPSPITLYFFQLKGADTFNSADFFSLYNDPQKTLGQDYIGMGKTDVAPGGRIEVSFSLSDDTQYVGIMAAYQQLPRAVWRVTIPMNSWGKERVYLYVNQFAITASKVETMADKATSAGQSAMSTASSMSSSASSGSSSAAGSSSSGTSGSSSSGGLGGLVSGLTGGSSSSSASSGSTSSGSSSSGGLGGLVSSLSGNSGSSSSAASSGSSGSSSGLSRVEGIVNSLSGSNNTSSGAASSSAPSTATSSNTSTAPSTSTSSSSSPSTGTSQGNSSNG